MLWDSVTLIIQLQRPWLGEVREDSLIGRIPHPPPSYPHTMVGVRCHPYYRRGRMGPYHPPISQLPSRLAAPCLAWNLWSVIRALPLLHFDPLWSAQPRNFPFPTCPKASFSHLPIHTTHFILSLGIKHFPTVISNVLQNIYWYPFQHFFLGWYSGHVLHWIWWKSERNQTTASRDDQYDLRVQISQRKI